MSDIERDLNFEKWYVANYHDGEIHPSNLLDMFQGEYQNPHAETLHEVWQAANHDAGWKNSDHELPPIFKSKERSECDSSEKILFHVKDHCVFDGWLIDREDEEDQVFISNSDQVFEMDDVDFWMYEPQFPQAKREQL